MHSGQNWLYRISGVSNVGTTILLTGRASIWSTTKCFRFLKESIFKSNKEHIIVVTHHVPSLELLAPEFTGSPLNGAFTVDLTDYITNNPIDYWIYGHSHRNIDKIIGGTNCVTNQLGYVFYNEHLACNPNKFIEIY